MCAMCGSLTTVVLLGSAALLGASPQEPSDAPDRVPSDFVRFVKVEDGGHLDTAITTYRKGEVVVTLFGAVHIADQACYEALNDRFTTCDALLYELVGPSDYRPSKEREREGFNPIAILQQGLKNSLELQFQLDAVDYSPANFVHADMTPEEFEQSMAERGETLLGVMLNLMLSGMEMQRAKAEAGAEPPPAFDLVKAFRTGEGRHTLRMVFATQLEEMEVLVAGGKDGTLLQGRNEKCLRVLEREIAAGRQRIGIYYGAAHLPHMERRLVQDLGFTKIAHEWLVAWDCRKRPDVKFDRAVVKARQQCRDELAALAAVVRDYRRTTDPGPPPAVDALAASSRGDKPWYAGPVQDPWGRPYAIRKRAIGSRWEVASSGQDGVFGTADDMIESEPRR